MTTVAIGDIHGMYDMLARLLVEIDARAGPGCLNRSPQKLSGFLPGSLGCGASRVWRDARRA